MPTFVLDSDRFRAVTEGSVLPKVFTEPWCAAVRLNVTELLGYEVLPVRSDDGDPPLLVGVMTGGRLMTVAVLPELDAVRLGELIARAGAALSQSWDDLAQSYVHGPKAFGTDWWKFRRTAQVNAARAPNLTIITGVVHAGVGDALDLLNDVAVLRARVQQLDERTTLDLGDHLGPEVEHIENDDGVASAAELRRLADFLGAPVQIEARTDSGRSRATLDATGRIVLADGTSYTDLHSASIGAIGHNGVDPWQQWRLAQWDAPLAEARAEITRMLSGGGEVPAATRRRGRRVL